MTALSKYIASSEPEELSAAYQAVFGDSALLSGSFKSPQDPPVRGFLPTGELAGKSSPLTYTVSGRGPLWGKTSLTWRPQKADLSPASQNGLVLSRDYTVVKPDESAPGRTEFSRGEVVRVTVTLLTHTPSWSLVLEDRIPAGFEAVDFNMGDSDRSLASSAR